MDTSSPARIEEAPRQGAAQPSDQSLSDGGREAEPSAQTTEQTSTQSQAVPPYDPNVKVVINRGNPNRKMVALTIDDGWGRDDRILDLLESYGIRCTVFVIGGRGVGETNPEWIQRMDRAGFEVCTHTYSHYKLTNHTRAWISEDIRKGREVIASVTGKYYPYMRPPGGFINDAVRQAAAENHCYVVTWTNSLGDTNAGVSVEGEVSAVLARLSNGGIILCHFGGYHTYEALVRLIPEIENRGYQLVTLTELLTP